MKIRQKVGLIVLATVLVIAGLFVLRQYFGNKLGIFADVLTNEKVIFSKRVAAGDFDTATLTNLVKVGDALQIQNQIGSADSWSTGTAGGTARGWHTSVLSNGKIYSWGGFNSSYSASGELNTLDIYGIASNTWSTGAAGGTARSGHSSVLYNGKIYSWGGASKNNGYLNTVDIYDIASNSWSTGTAGGTAKANFGSALSGGKIYYLGGVNTGNLNQSTVDIYDIASNSWSTGTAGGTSRRSHFQSAFSNGKIYSWGGWDGTTQLNTMDIYDISSDSWSTGAAGGTGRSSLASALSSGKIYFWGGGSNIVDIYDIASDSWSTGAAGGTGRNGPSSVLNNNKIYFWGGSGAAGYLNTMDIYNLNPVSTAQGSVSGQIDLGANKPISSLRVATTDFLSPRDEVTITTEISKNGTDWVAGQETSGLRYNFQGTAPRDSYCYRYIKYNIKLKTTASDLVSAVKFSGFDIYGGDICGTETALDPGAVNNLVTACSNGIDDDGGGKTDFKADGTGDPGCTNAMDDSEANAVKICQNGSNESIQLAVNITTHIDDLGADLGKNVFVGSNVTPLTAPATIQLVADGVAAKDSGFQDKVNGLAVYRGEGYFFLYNQSDDSNLIQTESEMIGDFAITGSKITKVINYSYQNPSNGITDPGNPTEDEYVINVGESSGTFTSTARVKGDGVYIYYEYAPKIPGGCQCQDGIDNDGNGLIDFPNDQGCRRLIDNTEVTAPPVVVVPLPACSNGLDDDGDGKIDFPTDTDCTSAEDDSEQSPVVAPLPACSDGIDNDTNGLVDFPADPGCSSATDIEEKTTLVILASQPASILPALISSGPGFWVVIVVILLISGGLIYIIIKRDKNNLVK